MVSASSQLKLRVITPPDINDDIVEAWLDLEAQAIEANAFLSPDFVLPAIEHLTAESAAIQVLLVEGNDGDSYRLLGVGLFSDCPATKQFPLRHLKAFNSRYSFLSGLLLHRDYAKEALGLIFDYFSRCSGDWHAVEFDLRSGEGPLDAVMDEVSGDLGLKWFEYERVPRAMLIPAECGEGCLEGLSAKRKKDIRRYARRLADHGPVSWRMIHEDNIRPENLNGMLDLEHLGWKGEKGTSLRSNPADTCFFREMIERFAARGQAYFHELHVGDTLVASTSNLLSGGAGFAFKLGWDPAYAKMSPGLLNLIEFVKNADTLLGELDYIDSGASGDSFMNIIWPRRRTLVSGIYATSLAGKLTLSAFQSMRSVKRTYRSMSRQDRSSRKPSLTSKS